MTTTPDTGGKPSRRGFAAMDPERRREIARRGGASVPSDKRSFAQDRDLAANAGRKGGAASKGGGRKPKAPPSPSRPEAIGRGLPLAKSCSGFKVAELDGDVSVKRHQGPGRNAVD